MLIVKNISLLCACVNSVQTLTVGSVSSAAGSIAQSKAVADMLTLYGKRSGVVMILISQIVKSGDFSGSREYSAYCRCYFTH